MSNPTSESHRSSVPSYITAVGCGLGLFGAAALGLGVLLVSWVNRDYGADPLAIGMGLATLPVPLYAGMALWIDRYEPEPPAMLLGAFLWGSCIAAIFSYMINTSVFYWIYIQLQNGGLADDLNSMVGAPVTEECAKGAGLLFLYLVKRKEFDGVVDGVIYATMIALGFSMMENVHYYAKAFAVGGNENASTVFFLRGVISPFAHPLFTSMTGIGLGWTCENPKAEFRWFAPLAGLALAIFLHFAWNFGAGIHSYLWILIYLGIMIPCLVGVGITLARALGREGQWLKHYLIKDLSFLEMNAVCSISGRIKFSLGHLRRGGPRAWLRSEEYLQVASQLAFARRRIENGHPAVEGEVDKLWQSLQSLRSQLNGHFSRPT